jgi:hypothetical protein
MIITLLYVSSSKLIGLRSPSGISEKGSLHDIRPYVTIVAVLHYFERTENQAFGSFSDHKGAERAERPELYLLLELSNPRSWQCPVELLSS